MQEPTKSQQSDSKPLTIFEHIKNAVAKSLSLQSREKRVTPGFGWRGDTKCFLSRDTKRLKKSRRKMVRESRRINAQRRKAGAHA